jgi:heterodisulfide reductase subunit A-like polyferredoxin
MSEDQGVDMAEQSAGPRGTILVVGGGIAGLTVAIEAAEMGSEVYLVERSPTLGGRVGRMHRYFPKLCPPACGLEILLKRLRANPKIHVLTLAEVRRVKGKPGDLEVRVKQRPRYVNDRCTACADCLEVCPAERPDDVNFGLSKTKAIYLPQLQSHPVRYVIDRDACPPDCDKCVAACKPQAIELDMEGQSLTLRVGSVVMATGWQPYDAGKLDGLGFGELPDVITNVMMERLAAPAGPTRGKITRPSDGKAPKHVTFVQCAGSRDEEHLPYCSAVCCLASLKQATYVRDQLPDTEVHMLYIDVRAPGRFEQFYTRVAADPKVKLSRGKAANVRAASGGRLAVQAEDTLTGTPLEVETDLVVLATGMQPSELGKLANHIDQDGVGFLTPDARRTGVWAAGCARRPGDVMITVEDATGTAMHAIQACQRRESHG